MRDRFPLVFLGGLLLLAVLGNFVLEGGRRGSFADTLSTYRSEPDGARALYLLAQAQGIRVQRYQQDLELIPAQQSLVLLAVEFSDGAAGDFDFDKERFFGANADGGTAQDDEDPDDESKLDEEDKLHRGMNALRVARVSADEREKLLAHVKGGATLVLAPWRREENALLKELGVSLVPASRKLGLRTLVPALPSAFTQGVERLEVPVRNYLHLPATAVPLLLDDVLDEPVAAVVPWGQGQVVVLGAPALAMNQHLALADNARFWASLLSALQRPGGPAVGFDEFHHGFTGGRNAAAFATRYGLQYALAQLLLGVGFWALALRRFGRPRQPQESARRASTDVLSATSRLYREGRHGAHAADALLKTLAADCAALCGLPLRTPCAEVTRALAAQGRATLAQALETVEALARRAQSDLDVEKVATAAVAARALMKKKDLNPRREMRENRKDR